MAFSFYGVFSTGQLQELVNFSNIQEIDIAARITYLQREAEINGIFTTTYDPTTNYPTQFTCIPPNSYGAKLLQVYRILGGVPERDMLLRTSDQPVFLTRGTSVSSDPTEVSGYSDTYSNGRVYRGNQRFDRDLGLLVQQLKAWQLEAIKRKREHIEFKIKRCLDYSDQLQNEIILLQGLINTATNQNVTTMIGNIQSSMLQTGTANVVDNIDDIHGLGIGKVGDKTFSSDLLTQDARNLRGMT